MGVHVIPNQVRALGAELESCDLKKHFHVIVLFHGPFTGRCVAEKAERSEIGGFRGLAPKIEFFTGF